MRSFPAFRRVALGLALPSLALLALAPGCGNSDDCAVAGCASFAAAGSAGMGGETNQCTASFSGDISGTVACSATMTYDSASDQTTLTVSGGEVGGGEWSSFSFSFPGQPPYTLIQGTSTTRVVDVVIGAQGERWLTQIDQTTMIGSAEIRITGLGVPSASADGSMQYPAPHGTGIATLVDQNPSTARPDLTQLITF